MTDSNGLRHHEPQTPQGAPGRKMLRVVSIVSIIYGCFGVVSQLLFIGPILLFGDNHPQITLSDNLFRVASAVVISVFQILVGLIGVKNCNNIEKAAMLRVAGAIYLIVFIVFPIVFFVAFPIAVVADTAVTEVFIPVIRLSNLIGSAIVAVLPIIYLRGAQKNLRAWREKRAV